MELDGPTETGFGVGGEDETRISLDTHWPIMRSHRGGLLGGMEHSQFLSSLCSLQLSLTDLCVGMGILGRFKNKCEMGNKGRKE